MFGETEIPREESFIWTCPPRTAVPFSYNTWPRMPCTLADRMLKRGAKLFVHSFGTDAGEAWRQQLVCTETCKNKWEYIGAVHTISKLENL